MKKTPSIKNDIEKRKEIAQRLEVIRNNMRITKIEFANILGISDGYYGTISKGENFLAADKLINLAISSGVSIDYLLLGKQSNNDEINLILEKLSPTETVELITIIKSICSFIKKDETLKDTSA